jgi:hypothetical protein
MKRDYIKPAMRFYKLQQKCHILVGSDMVGSNTANTIVGEELDFIGGGIGPGR